MNSQKLLERGYFADLSQRLEKTRISSGQFRGKESESSRSIINEGDVALTIINAFGIEDSEFESFRRGFGMATDGDGDEERRILTIHSSSLLALLCFFSVSEKNPLKIGDCDYTEVFFEVKNIVIKKDNRKPSNVDVVLVSKSKDGRIRKLLFLESKFTEYVHHGHVKLASKYHPFYNFIKENIDSLEFNISDFILHHRDGSTSAAFGLWADRPLYLDGIKQAFSHLLGIATSPAEDSNRLREEYKKYYYSAEEIEFGTIVHDWNKKEFENYATLYATTFKNEGIIKNGLKTEFNSDIIGRLKILPTILTYSAVFRDFRLPGIVRKAYKL